MDQLQIGHAKISWLSGGDNHLDGGAMFGVVPKALWGKKYPSNEKNQIPLRTDPLLIQVDGKNILVDTGIGQGKLTEKQKRNFGVQTEADIEKELQQCGLEINDIDFIVMTHLHFDHASGLTKKVNDSYVSAFPHIPIITSAVEWEEMQAPNIRSEHTYWQINWEAITSQVETFTTERQITPHLKIVHTGGHSAGHAILVYEDTTNCFIHMADLMATHAHQHVLWVMAYDDYPIDSIRAKEKWLQYGYKRKAWYTFYHDAFYRAIQYNEQGEILQTVKRNDGS